MEYWENFLLEKVSLRKIFYTTEPNWGFIVKIEGYTRNFQYIAQNSRYIAQKSQYKDVLTKFFIYFKNHLT